MHLYTYIYIYAYKQCLTFFVIEGEGLCRARGFTNFGLVNKPTCGLQTVSRWTGVPKLRRGRVGGRGEEGGRGGGRGGGSPAC